MLRWKIYTKVVPYVLSAVFIAGAAYKQFAPAESIAAVATLGVTRPYAVVSIHLVCFLELYIGVNLLRRSRQTIFCSYSAFLLMIFTVILLAMKALGARSCGCTPVDSLARNAINPMLFSVLRNLVLLGAVEAFLWAQSPASTSGKTDSAGTLKHDPTVRSKPNDQGMQPGTIRNL